MNRPQPLPPRHTPRFDRLLSSAFDRADAPAIIADGRTTSYGELAMLRSRWSDELDVVGVRPGDVVAIRSDYAADAIALLLAVLRRQGVAVLVPPDLTDDGVAWLAPRAWFRDGRLEPGEAGVQRGALPLLDRLTAGGGSGFVVFTSGTSGEPRAVLHDIERFLGKYDRRGRRHSTLAFLLFDHIAGIDTLLYTLVHGGTLVVPSDRDPDAVAALIAAHRVEVLPASPTFLRFLCLSGAGERHDLSSVRVVTYGSEPMSQATLDRVAELFERAEIQQKYGTSELGSPATRSKDRSSLWLRVRDLDVETRIEEGILWVRSPHGMLGYLNADSPIDDEGWLCTGDRVEEDGEWIRILGREGSLINVGGEKVYPEEVEAAIAELPWVIDVEVRGDPHPLTGQIVHAVVRSGTATTESQALRDVRAHCLKSLARHKIPMKITLTDADLAGHRQKKQRATGSAAGPDGR